MREILELRQRSMNWTLAAVAVISAVIATAGLLSSDRAVANNKCLAFCKAERDNCRIETKNSPKCEKTFTRCMLSCARG